MTSSVGFPVLSYPQDVNVDGFVTAGDVYALISLVRADYNQSMSVAEGEELQTADRPVVNHGAKGWYVRGIMDRWF